MLNYVDLQELRYVMVTSKQNQPRRRDNIRLFKTTEDERQSSSESSESYYCYAVNTNHIIVIIIKNNIRLKYIRNHNGALYNIYIKIPGKVLKLIKQDAC